MYEILHEHRIVSPEKKIVFSVGILYIKKKQQQKQQMCKAHSNKGPQNQKILSAELWKYLLENITNVENAFQWTNL